MKKFAIITGTLLAFAFVWSLPSYADELTVTGNGSNSESQVSVSSNNNTSTTQSNTATVENNSSVTANTGNNTASSNTNGETAIHTGNVSVDSSVQNSLNASSVNNGCCPNTTNATVSGNGSNSQNGIDLSRTNSSTTVVTQNATIINNIYGSANTGRNSANNNGGDTFIHTGAIWVTDTIKNGPINVSSNNIQSGLGSIDLAISGNGTDSTNTITTSFDSTNNVYNIFNANIINNSKWNLNTGENYANRNIGGADIKTGDILFASVIENGPINVSKIDVTCCETEKKECKEKPEENKPSVPTASVGGSTPGVGGSSSSGGGGIGSLLPVTGSLWTLYMSLASIVLFFFGWYLRFRSGNAPPRYAYITA